MKNMTYTITILVAVTIAFLFPQFFIGVGDFKFSELIVPLLQIIMFGVGATLTVADFVGIVKTPKKVIIGLVCQFSIMPVVGFVIAKAFNFPAEIAAGLILIGCSPSGLASNVMCLIAKANVALSVTLTTFATLLAPFFTPVLLNFFGGEFIEIDTMAMFWSIIKMVIIPVALGFALNEFLPKLAERLRKFLPLLSMGGIAIILMIIVAAGQESLKTVGFALIFAVLLHNCIGYFMGYYAAKAIKLNEIDCRTIALEVGMQNGGLASGLAKEMGKIATVGLAPAIFGSMMNVTGSVLASFWSGRLPKED